MTVRRRTRVLLGLLVLGVAIGAWLTVRALEVRAGLGGARAVLTGAPLTASTPTAELEAVRARASTRLEQARGAVDDPLWRLASAVPVAGRSFTVARDATRVAELLVDGVLPAGLRGLRQLEDGGLLLDGQVDLDLLRDVGTEVRTAADAAAQARRTVQAMPDDGVPSPVSGPAAELRAQVERLADALTTAQASLDVLPGALGGDGVRRWLVAVQNNAEARGTGGLIGAYAVVRAEDGRISLDAVGSNLDLRTADEPVVDLGPEFAERYDLLAGRTLWSSANLSPDWPSAAQVVRGLWTAQGGGRVDGVVGVDPVSMANILAVTGPAQVDGREVSAENVVRFVTKQQYAELSTDNEVRKGVLAVLAEAFYDRVAAGGWSGPAMLRGLGAAGASGHLQVWSAHEREQALLGTRRVGGALPATAGSYLQIVSNNAAGNKADAYLRRQVAYERPAPGRGRVRVTLINDLGTVDVPAYVTRREGRLPAGAEAGQTRLQVSIFVGLGQTVGRVLVDGVEVSPRTGTERGHGVATVLVEVRPSRPAVITAEVSDPGGELVYRQQPLVADDGFTADVPHRRG